MVGDGGAPAELGLAIIGIIQSPVSPDRAFELAFPGLVERLDHVDPIVVAFGLRQHLLHDARLIGAGRQRALAHPAGARPAELADQDVPVGKAAATCARMAPTWAAAPSTGIRKSSQYGRL